MKRTSLPAIALLPLLACGETASPPVGGGVEATAELQPLESGALLRRLSLDLRGTVPSSEELARIEEDPTALDLIVEEMIADPRYERRLMRMFAEQFLTRVDEFAVPGTDYGIDDEYAFTRALGEEPLRLLAWVASHDRAWTEAVTADYTMSNETLRQVLQITAIDGEEEDEEGWVRSTYTDNRPAGGIVMTSGFWWRYSTTVGNLNRGRAAAISRLLLCQDLLERPVEFGDVDLTDESGTAEAVLTNPTCVSCHSAIDPIAATLYGFWWFDNMDASELAVYHPEREPLGIDYLSVESAWFGLPLDGPTELGWRISKDPRFLRCTAQRAARALLRRPMEVEDLPMIQALASDLVAADYRYEELVREILASDEYRAGALGADASALTEDRVRIRRPLTIDQIETSIEDLTGFTWTWEGYDQLDNDLSGYRVLGGGVDGEYVLQPAPVLTVASISLMMRLAEASAQTVVAHDLSVEEADRRLLPPGDLAAMDPGSAELSEAVSALHTRILSAPPDQERLAQELELWEKANLALGPTQAWTSLVSVILQDPDFLTY